MIYFIFSLQNDRHDDGNASKDELRRERRERLVKKGVQEKGKLKEMYTGRKQELEQAQERRKEELWLIPQDLCHLDKSFLNILKVIYVPVG